MEEVKQKHMKARVSREELMSRLPIPGPGRPKQTEEQKIVNRAVKELVSEYEENLAQVLPELSPVVKEKALAGDIQFVKELHNVVGIKRGKEPLTAIQINVGELRDKYK